MFAISKLKFIHTDSFYRVLSLLAGDIEINPGPNQPCKACMGKVNKRSLFCNCGIAYHKKCLTIKTNDGPFLCRDCISKADNITTTTTNEQLQYTDTVILDNLDINTNDYIQQDPDGDLADSQHHSDGDLADNLRPFKKKGMHFLHLNVNSLLSKIHEIRQIALDSGATIIGITETKLDKTVFDNEVNIDGYNIIRKDRIRHGGGVCCYVKNNRSYKVREDFGSDFENVFLDILLPNSKPILIGILYRPPNQTGFLECLSSAIIKADRFDNQEVYLLGDFNFNLINLKGKYIYRDDMNVNSWYKNYINFCNSYSLKQLIRTATRTANGKSSLLDHILTNTDKLILQAGVVNVGISDH